MSSIFKFSVLAIVNNSLYSSFKSWVMFLISISIKYPNFFTLSKEISYLL